MKNVFLELNELHKQRHDFNYILTKSLAGKCERTAYYTVPHLIEKEIIKMPEAYLAGIFDSFLNTVLSIHVFRTTERWKRYIKLVQEKYELELAIKTRGRTLFNPFTYNEFVANTQPSNSVRGQRADIIYYDDTH